jgi:two-component system, LytTR family, response regulator
MPLDPGITLAHYRILKRLGSGGMGEVYLATDDRLDRQVAVKILPADFCRDPERLQLFTLEAKITSGLNHPNLTHVYDIGREGDVSYLVMEHVEGEALNARLDEGPLPLKEALAIGGQIADALDAAHQSGVVHRDIKPGNVMVNRRGHAKVLDFGLAKICSPKSAGRKSEDTQALSDIGLVMGTVQYMSPEQALGREVDARSDLFSFGALLYEMITGRLPFDGANPQEVLAKVLTAQPDAIGRFNYEVPAELERIVRKCLEKDPEDRYQSAREIVLDLRALAKPATVDASVAAAAAAAAKRKSSSGKLTAVIVDDEELARLITREYLKQCAPDIEVAAECGNGFEAVKVIHELAPDLVFLDIQMPKLDGFEVLELIDHEPAVIFATAFDQYAMKAFDAHAVDYLLKPFSLDRFQTALQRARQRLGEKPAIAASDLKQEARPSDQPFAERIVVKDGPKVQIIPIDKLDYAEAQDDYVCLYSLKKGYLKQQTISSLEASLDPKRFLRIHRSHIVNLERVAKIEPYTKDSKIAILQDGTQLPVSRAGYQRLKAFLDERA